jgi:hypothetical protein
MWQIEFTDEFGEWWNELSEEEQEEIDARVRVLEHRGPGLGRPLVDSIASSRHPNMKELRGGSIRILFAFDPRRVAILLIGATSATIGQVGTKWRFRRPTISTTSICAS